MALRKLEDPLKVLDRSIYLQTSVCGGWNFSWVDGPDQHRSILCDLHIESNTNNDNSTNTNNYNNLTYLTNTEQEQEYK